MADVLFINPPSPDKDIIIRDINRSGRKTRERMIWPQTNLAYMAAMVKDRLSVNIIDCIALNMRWNELQEILEQEKPKYVVAMGACASGGGPFKEGYNVVSGIDKFLPVDVYIPGCPPTPQALLFGLMKLQEMIDQQSIKTVRWYQKEPLEAIPIPILGPDLIDTRDFDDFQEKLAMSVPVQEAQDGEGTS